MSLPPSRASSPPAVLSHQGSTETKSLTQKEPYTESKGVMSAVSNNGPKQEEIDASQNGKLKNDEGDYYGWLFEDVSLDKDEKQPSATTSHECAFKHSDDALNSNGTTRNQDAAAENIFKTWCTQPLFGSGLNPTQEDTFIALEEGRSSVAATEAKKEHNWTYQPDDGFAAANLQEFKNRNLSESDFLQAVREANGDGLVTKATGEEKQPTTTESDDRASIGSSGRKRLWERSSGSMTVESSSFWEESDAVVAVALYNYEVFYKMKPGTANIGMVQCSSAGLAGWSSCVMNDSSSTSRFCDDQEKKKARSSTKKKGDEDEERQLQVALLRSVGVDAEYHQWTYLHDEDYGSDDEADVTDEDCSDSQCWYDSHREDWAIKDKTHEKEDTESKRAPEESNSSVDTEEKELEPKDNGPDSADKCEADDSDSSTTSFQQVEPVTRSPDNKAELSDHKDDASAADSHSTSTGSFVNVKSDSESTPGSATESEESFVVVEATRPRINRSTWQWRNLVQHVEESATADVKADVLSDVSSDFERI